MAELYLLRHFPTDWNIARRIQGKSDIPLSAESQTLLRKIELPEEWKQYHWVSSPLLRARQTAHALGIDQPQIVHALTEMNWGEFEGMFLSDIEKQITAQQATLKAGLHFRPPDGETPAEVRSRIETWLGSVQAPTTVAVTHKGVIRAALSLATGWNMESPIHQMQPNVIQEKINWLLPLKFSFDKERRLQLEAINVEAWQSPKIE